MPPNRKHHAVDSATAERWALLGRLFRARRLELGYGFRPAFAEARLPKTQDGNLMIRMVVTVENSERPGTYSPGRLEQFARAYDVTLESVHAVLRGDAGKLEPAPPAAVSPWRPLPAAPMDDEGRESSVRPYAVRLWDGLLRLAGQGVTDPSGVMLGLSPADAKVWDGSAGAMSLADRAWLVADMQRRRAARTADSRSGTAGA